MGVRINKLGGADQVIRYYTQRGMEAYYSENQEFNGFWGGKAAAMLGLEGPLGKEEFSRLARNLHPLTGEQLTERMRTDRRSGHDFTFDVCKPISLAYAYTGDDRIMQAIRQAIRDTLAEMELRAATRVRAGEEKNTDKNRETGNWITAEIIHLTARPEDGFPDPHVHVHVVVFNLTFDPVEAKWKALQLRPIHDDMKYYQGAFDLRVRENLERIGLKTEPAKYGYNLEGFPRDLTDKFSRRTQKIEATAERLGITDPELKARLGALTRENKDKSLTMPELAPLWWSGLSEEHKTVLEGIKSVLARSKAAEMSRQLVPEVPEPELPHRTAELLGTQDKVPTVETKESIRSADHLGTKKQAKIHRSESRQSQNWRTRPLEGLVEPEAVVTEHDRRAVRLAKEHLFERESMVTEKKLIGEAFSSWCVGRATRRGIIKVVHEEMDLLWKNKNGENWVTTPDVIEEERWVCRVCREGRGRFDSINKYWKFEDDALNDQQKAAVRHALTSTDWVVGIMGKSGTGKTRLLNELRQGVQGGLYRVVALAPSGKAARVILRQEGFKNANTVTRFLFDRELQKQAAGGVIFVDEAGLLSMPLTAKLFEKAREIEARLRLVGDSGQHHSVERGQAFDLLQRVGRMATAEVKEIVRQKGEYKEFVKLVDAGEIQKAFAVKGIMDRVVEVEREMIAPALARDYVEALQQNKTVAAVAPTNAECERINESIHARLKEQKMLGESRPWEVLKNLGWSKATRMDEDKYRPGLVVQFNQRVKGFAKGEQVEVINVREGAVRVRAKNGLNKAIKKLPLTHAHAFNVYERGQIEVSVGSEIRVTNNTLTLDDKPLENGSSFKVDYFDRNGNMILEDGSRLDRSFVHFKYAYASTSHTAQGSTVDVVLLGQEAVDSTPASDRTQFYVSTSRGREDFRIYTDSLEHLKEDVEFARERPMATEMFAEPLAQELGTKGEVWAGAQEVLGEMKREQEDSPSMEIEL